MKQTFITVPGTLGNGFVQYLRARQAQLKAAAAPTGKDGRFDEALGLQSLASSFRQVEAVLLTDIEMSRQLADQDPETVKDNAVNVVEFKPKDNEQDDR